MEQSKEQINSTTEKLTNEQSVLSYHYWFDKIGIRPKDMAKALIYFKTMSYISYFTLFGLSYRYQFLSKFLKTETGLVLIKNIKLNFPKLVEKTEHYSQKMSSYIATNKYLKQIPITLGLKTKRFGEALVETTIIYKLSLPLYFYGTYKLINYNYKTNSKNTN